MALYSYFEKDQYAMALPNKVFHSILYSMVMSNFWAFTCWTFLTNYLWNASLLIYLSFRYLQQRISNLLFIGLMKMHEIATNTGSIRFIILKSNKFVKLKWSAIVSWSRWLLFASIKRYLVLQIYFIEKMQSLLLRHTIQHKLFYNNLTMIKILELWM